MPQLDDWDHWSESNLISFDANNDETISFEILEGLNMSFFDHYAKYNGNGGGNDMYNFVNISEIKILFRNSHEENNWFRTDEIHIQHLHFILKLGYTK